MEDDSRVTPLSRRAPGSSGGPRPPVGTGPTVLSEAALKVAQAALDAARAHNQGAGGVAQAAAGPEQSGPWFGVDPEADTQPIPVVTAAARSAPPAPVAPPEVAAPVAPAGPPPLTPYPVKSPAPPSRPAPKRPAPKKRPAGAEHPAAEHPVADHPDGLPRRRYRMAGALATVLVVVGAGSLALALSWHPSGNTASAAAAASEQAVRGAAATWVAGQVGPAAMISCDPVMCQALQDHGLAAARLLSLGPAGVTPLSSSVVVATKAVRAEFGGKLGSVYAPIVLASFGDGNLRIDVRAVAPHGAAAYLAALKADQQARATSGSQLLRTERITLPPAVQAQLVRGQVDTRLLVVLANLAALQPVSVVSFGHAALGASPGVPLRSADLAVTHANGPGSAQSMMSILRDQTGLYQPASIQTVRLAHGRSVLRVAFPAPSPLGLLGPSTSSVTGPGAGAGSRAIRAT